MIVLWIAILVLVLRYQATRCARVAIPGHKVRSYGRGAYVPLQVGDGALVRVTIGKWCLGASPCGIAPCGLGLALAIGISRGLGEPEHYP